MSDGRTYFADDVTLKRLEKLEEENKKLRGLLEEAREYTHPAGNIRQRINAALEGKV